MSEADDADVPVTTNELFELKAKIMAEELLLRRYSRTQAARAMGRDVNDHGLGLSLRRAMKIVDAVIAEWRETAGTVREELREQQLRVLDNLYKSAFADKRYAACVQVERLRAEITGTLAPKRMHVTAPVQAGGASMPAGFEDRSLYEYDYFATHGEWPVEEVAVH